MVILGSLGASGPRKFFFKTGLGQNPRQTNCSKKVPSKYFALIQFANLFYGSPTSLQPPLKFVQIFEIWFIHSWVAAAATFCQMTFFCLVPLFYLSAAFTIDKIWSTCRISNLNKAFASLTLGSPTKYRFNFFKYWMQVN